MTYVPTSYTQAEAGLNQVTMEVAAIMDSVRTAIARIDAANVKLGQLDDPAPVGYIELLNFITEQTASNPGDAEWIGLQGRMNKIAGDFGTLQAYLTNLTAAISAV
jgi:hypothetical protein